MSVTKSIIDFMGLIDNEADGTQGDALAAFMQPDSMTAWEMVRTILVGILCSVVIAILYNWRTFKEILSNIFTFLTSAERRKQIRDYMNEEKERLLPRNGDDLGPSTKDIQWARELGAFKRS